jgi:hypothetical protein
VAGDDLFGPDGTQALQADALLGDPLGGLVTGGAYAAGGNSAQERAEVADIRVEVPEAPAAPDQAPLRAAVDKAMMTGPPTNPLRLPTFGTPQPVRPAPTVSLASPPPPPQPVSPPPPRPAPLPMPRQQRPVRPPVAGEARFQMTGQPPLRRSRPVVSGLVRVVVGLAIVIVLLILVLRGSGSGGNLSDLFG